MGVLRKLFDINFERTGNQKMPRWTVFHAMISHRVYDPTNIGYCQLIAVPPTDFNTVYTVLARAESMFQRLRQQVVILTRDEALYSKAQIIKWRNPQDIRNVFNRLGGFHRAKDFMGIIGTIMKGVGLEDILNEGNIYGVSAVAKILEGKSYNRRIRAHKVTYEALWLLKLKEFGEWALAQNNISEEEQNWIINTLQECVRQFGLSVKKDGEQEEESELLSSVENFRRELNLLFPYLQTFEDLLMATSQIAAF